MIININEIKFNHCTFFPLLHSSNVVQTLDEKTRELINIIYSNIKEVKLFLSAFDKTNIFLNDLFVTAYETDIKGIIKYNFCYKDKEISTALLVLNEQARKKLIDSSFIYKEIPNSPVLLSTPYVESFNFLNEHQLKVTMQIIAGVEKALTFCIMK